MVNNKKGGDLSQDLAKLAVPFGLIAAQQSLKNYLDSKKTVPKKNNSSKTQTNSKKNTNKKPVNTNKKTVENKRRTVGGKSCKSLNSA